MSNKNKFKGKRNRRAKAAVQGWSKRKLQTTVGMNKNEINNVSQEIFTDFSNSSSFEDIEDTRGRNPSWCSTVYKGPGKRIRVEEFEEYGVIPSDEYERIMDHELEIEYVKETRPNISGNRIVELGYVIEQVLSIQRTHLKVCTLANIRFHKEIRRGTGLVSRIELKCSACEKIFSFNTENPENEVINLGFVWGTLASGSSYLHTNELLSSVDIPAMPQKMFSECEEYISEELKLSLWLDIENTGKRERMNALENGNLCSDGTPWIVVYVDGSWSKRSYGTNFNALSGMVGIIGKHTGELLYIAVRNKYCSICARAKTRNTEPGIHLCYKNWDGPTTAMEADMAVEGFCQSEQMHGVRYCKFIADGDSSVYAKLKREVPYGRDIKKIECTNHALKNYGKHLRNIKNDTSISLAGRKLLTIANIKKLTKRAKCSIYEHSKNGQNVTLLKYDLENGFHHVYGDHSKCINDNCNNVGDLNDNQIPLLKSTKIYNHIKGTVDLLVRKAHLLIENENNNAAERLMNIIARFNMGKRVNFIQRNSYSTRVYLAGLRYNESYNWSYAAWRNIFHKSPGKYFKKFVEEQSIKHASKIRRRLFDTPKTSKRRPKEFQDLHYGKHAEQPEMEEEIVVEECKKLINDLQITLEERNMIALESVGQFGNRAYEMEREKRLTASLFGRVMNRRPYTSCHGIVKSCLTQGKIFSVAVEYGICKESVAIALFEQKTKLKVQKSGLWIDLKHGFLGASPDGLVGDDALIEVKCLFACSQLNATTLDEMLDINKKTCLKKNNGKVSLKRNHPYYFQVQGQLNICQRSKCYFIVYINGNIDLFVEEINRDEELWNKQMLPKLCQFYEECIGPELVRGNLLKNKKCMDPPFILRAQKDYEEYKLKQCKSKQAGCNLLSAENT